MTPERIAEIEELAATKAPMVYVRAGSIRELCRLARLGLRVEGAPTTRAKDTPTAWRGPTWLAYQPLPNEWVALSRVAAGEDVEQVMRDYGWERKP